MIVILYERIKALCKERGITISVLERESQVGNGVIGAWRSSAPRLSTLTKVAHTLGVPLSELVEGIDYEP